MFFIAPIGAADSPERKRSDGVLRYIVSRAAVELDLVAVRADQIATPGQINLQVVDHVLTAKAAVADLTGLNPNVFYEMAIRHTARLPLVIIAEVGCKLPFDIAQMRTIFVDHQDLESADECRTAIVSQLKSTLNDGVVDSPIATSIDLSSMSGGTAVERSVAEMVTSVEQVAQTQKSLIDVIERRLGNVYSPRRSSISPRALRDIRMSVDTIMSKTPPSDDPELTEALKTLRKASEYIERSQDNRHHGFRADSSSEEKDTLQQSLESQLIDVKSMLEFYASSRSDRLVSLDEE